MALYRLADKPGITLYSGMLSQGLIHFVEHTKHSPQIITGELAGDKELYDFCGRTPQVKMATVNSPNILALAQCPASPQQQPWKSTSGRAMVRRLARQISGVGGSRLRSAAALSEGASSSLRWPLNNRRRETLKDIHAYRLISRNHPLLYRYIVTGRELPRKGKDLRARAEALIAIAHPISVTSWLAGCETGDWG
jgi:hypothetical protein